jgi:hypothetical protein
MTPKEKAKELYGYYEFVYIQNYTSSFEVKQCCLIAIGEMKKLFDGLYKPEYCAFDAIGERKFTYDGEHSEHMTGYDMLAYLEEVEQELEKL